MPVPESPFDFLSDMSREEITDVATYLERRLCRQFGRTVCATLAVKGDAHRRLHQQINGADWKDRCLVTLSGNFDAYGCRKRATPHLPRRIAENPRWCVSFLMERRHNRVASPIGAFACNVLELGLLSGAAIVVTDMPTIDSLGESVFAASLPRPSALLAQQPSAAPPRSCG